MARNPEVTAEQRDQAQRLIKGGGRLEPDHQLPRGLEKQIESASRAIVPATRVMANAEPIDVVLIALFGTWGEDGRIQGLLDTLGIPYTGSSVLASALAMDKVMAKAILGAHGIDVPRGAVVRGTGRNDLEAARAVGLPVFVKPVASGSSVGASIVERAEDLEQAIAEAFRFEPPGPNARVLVEERITGRELTVAVIGNDDLQALPVIEIKTKRAFFDYSAKYDAGESEEICPAEIPEDVAKRAQAIAPRGPRSRRRRPDRRPVCRRDRRGHHRAVLADPRGVGRGDTSRQRRYRRERERAGWRADVHGERGARPRAPSASPGGSRRTHR